MSLTETRERLMDDGCFLLHSGLTRCRCGRAVGIVDISSEREAHRIDRITHLPDGEFSPLRDFFNRWVPQEHLRQIGLCQPYLTVALLLLTSQIARKFRAVKNRPANIGPGEVFERHALIRIESPDGSHQSQSALLPQVFPVGPGCGSRYLFRPELRDRRIECEQFLSCSFISLTMTYP